MGNIIDSCCIGSKGPSVNVIYWDGNTKTLMGRKGLAREIMFGFPESMVCDADRFYIGHPIPSLNIDDELQLGKTYFVLPLDIFSSHVLSTSSISSFVAHNYRRTPADLKECPLEYLKGSNGRVLIKIKSEFMSRHLTNRCGHGHVDQVIKPRCISSNVTNSNLCSTPELKKEYEQLVRSKDQIWSPNLNTISESKKVWYSPYRFIGMDLQEKEEDK